MIAILLYTHISIIYYCIVAIKLVPCIFFFADMTVKTISEEYTPLHLAARLIPHKPASQTYCDTDRVVPDSIGLNTSSIIGYLKQCEDVNVSPIKMLL